MTRAALVALAVILSLAQTQRSPIPLHRVIEQSTDVAWLERLCLDPAYATEQQLKNGSRSFSVKAHRLNAYVRLGAIGSAESLAAVARIEKRMRDRTVLPDAAIPGRQSNHPASHVSDWVLRPRAEVRLADGRDVAAYLLSSYGPPMPFLAIRAGGSWSRPMMIPLPVDLMYPPTIALQELANGRVRLTFSADPAPAAAAGSRPVPDAIEVALADVQRDSDGDGWTDIAERHLEMNWRRADSDDDGIDDGHDDAPAYSALRAPNDENAEIVRTSLFAMFGLTDAPGALFVEDDSPPVHPFGLPGPLFYGRWKPGAVRVRWKITSKTSDAATVELTDYEGALSASGNAVVMKKIGGSWYVVAIKLLWIS